jgi:hypothetical protein
MNGLAPTAAATAPRILPFLLRLLGLECGHDNYTRPMRLSGGTELTVSCLDCAARLRYDWDRMQPVHGSNREPFRTAGRMMAQPRLGLGRETCFGR